MTYNVFGGPLNLAQSINQSFCYNCYILFRDTSVAIKICSSLKLVGTGQETVGQMQSSTECVSRE